MDDGCLGNFISLISHLKVFHSYQVDGRMIMKGSVQ